MEPSKALEARIDVIQISVELSGRFLIELFDAIINITR